MGVNQTTTQNGKDISIGASAFHFSTDGGSSFINVGIANDIAFSEEITKLDVAVNNGSKPKELKGVADQTYTVTGNFLENSLLNISSLRGGIDTTTSVTDTPVVAAPQTVSSGNWEYDKPFNLAFVMSAAPSAVTVTGETDGALVENTDFFVIKQNAYTWGVYVIDSATVTTEAQDLTLAVSYTPVIQTVQSTGGGVEQDEIYVRLTNRTLSTADAADAAQTGITIGDDIYRVREYHFYWGTVNVGNTMTFKDKTDTDPSLPYAFSAIFLNDPDRTSKDQLGKVVAYNVKVSDVDISA
jgi:hypothetical protein